MIETVVQTAASPVFRALTPSLTRAGAVAWVYAADAFSFITASTAVYLVGRTTTNLIGVGLDRLSTRIIDGADKIRPVQTVKDRADKVKQRQKTLEAAIEAEIARRVRTGELQIVSLAAEVPNPT